MISEHRIQSFKSRLSQKENGCIEWTGCVDEHGYGVIGRTHNITRAHRFAYFLEHRELPAGMCVMHSCDNPRCCNPDHLSIGTHLENNADKVAKRRHAFGERSRSKVKEADVIAIRKLHAEGMTQAEIGRKFGVTQTGISLIVIRKTWRHVA